MQNRLRELRNERGVTAIEYGLIAALIAVVIIAAVTFVGDELVQIFTDIADALTGS
ncbi:MAG: Flp family type IVb pilin [Gaiellales bacterium]